MTLELSKVAENSISSIFLTIIVAPTPILKVELRVEFEEVSLGFKVYPRLSILIYTLQ